MPRKYMTGRDITREGCSRILQGEGKTVPERFKVLARQYLDRTYNPRHVPALVTECEIGAHYVTFATQVSKYTVEIRTIPPSIFDGLYHGRLTNA